MSAPAPLSVAIRSIEIEVFANSTVSMICSFWRAREKDDKSGPRSANICNGGKLLQNCKAAADASALYDGVGCRRKSGARKFLQAVTGEKMCQGWKG